MSTEQSDARFYMVIHLNENPYASCTELAEIAAILCDHPEWLDDPDSFIWDLAFEVWEQS
jgi:hypothetical protein